MDLFAACYADDAERVGWLLDGGCDAEARRLGETPLHVCGK